MSLATEQKKYAVGIVVKNRLELTYKTLMSLYFSTQSKSSYDIFIINNGSDQQTTHFLKDFATNELLPIKNIINVPEVSVSKAWNLFLLLAKSYPFRVKLDNDMILQNTISPTLEGRNAWHRERTDAEKIAETRSNPPIIGAFGPKKKKISKIEHSNFLDIMSGTIVDHSLGIIALVPVSPNLSFSVMFTEVGRKTWNGRPYLFGACMMISKQCFDTLGYFDERLPRRIDIEYSQRAIRNSINIGYVPNYGAVHMGATGSTETEPAREAKYTEAMRLEREFSFDRYSPSIWESRPERFLQFSHKHQVLNIIN